MLSFFQSIGSVIGGALVAVGSFLGGSVPVSTLPVVEEIHDESSVISETHVSIETKVESPKKSTVSSVPSTRTSTPEPAPQQKSVFLEIENIRASVNDTEATVEWNTTVPSNSRLIFDNGKGRVFESQNGLGTSHKIYVSGLEESHEYDYKITAISEDKKQEDDHYDILRAPKKYTAVFAPNNEKSCRVIVLKDTAGHIAAGLEVMLRPTYQKSGSIFAQGNTTATSNARGEITYCKKANTFRITGDFINLTITTQTEQSI